MLCIWRNDPSPGVWEHSERKGITAGTAGLSLSWAMSEGLSNSTSLSWGAWLSSVYPEQERVISGQIFLLLLVEFHFKINLFKMSLLQLVDSVSANYRGSDCVMLELCNSLIFPSLILFILILILFLALKVLSLSIFFFLSFYFFFQQKWKFIDMDQFLI